MSVKFKGNLEYNIEKEDETISHDNTNIIKVINNEIYSEASSACQDTQYRDVDKLETDEGRFTWETITTIGIDGTTYETELLEQPSNIEIIQNFTYEMIEEDSF